jgi:L-methionine (R)-S-oxide reductase
MTTPEPAHKKAKTTKSDYLKDKKEFYKELLEEGKSLVDGEKDLIANTANLSSLLYHSINEHAPNQVNWVGFYFMRDGELVLGPFQGKIACIRIRVGKGVCGTTVQNKKSMVLKSSSSSC